MSEKELLEQLAQQNPQALLLEPRDVYDAALVAITDEPEDHWPRKERVYVAVYDTDKCVGAVMGWLGCGYDEAQEWLDFNTYGAWLGEGTPTFCNEEAS
jgi:hypothetical protein|tara:strand:+ start:2901 stop:3197 length:297 start_codon:yes stop_codon:yes gene_type:complete